MAKVIFDSAFASANNTITNSDRTVEYTGGATGGLVFSSIGHRRDKYYVEFLIDNGNTTALNLGVGLVAADQAFTSTDYVGKASNSFAYWSSGVTKQNNTDTAVANTYTTGDVVQMAVDFQAGKVWFGKNGVWYGNPEAGTFQSYTFTVNRAFFPAVSCYTPNRKVTIKAAAADQTYVPPRDFSAWETYTRHSAFDIGTTTSTTTNLYNNNRNVYRTGSGDGPPNFTTDFKKSGKWYFEYKLVTVGVTSNFSSGLQTSETANTQWLGNVANSWGFWQTPGNTALDRWTSNALQGTVTSTASATNDIYMYAVDATLGRIWYGKNGTWLSSGDPATNTNPIFTDADITTFGFAPAVTPDQNFRLQLLSRSAELVHSVPAGFTAFDDSTVTIPADASNVRVSKVGVEILTQIPFTGEDTQLVLQEKSGRVSSIGMEVLTRVWSEKSGRVSSVGLEALIDPDTAYPYTTSIDFDGVDDYGQFAANSILNTIKGFAGITIGFWFKFDQIFAGTNGQKNVLLNIPLATGVTGLTVYLQADGKLGIGARSQSADTLQTVVSNATFVADTWYQINLVVNWTTKIIKIWQNGTLDTTSGVLTFGQNVLTPTTNTTVEEIGRNAAFANSNFDGHIVDLKFWNRVRTDPESIEDSTYYEYRNRNTNGMAAVIRLNEQWPFVQPLIANNFKIANGTYSGSPVSSPDVPFITANIPIQFNFSLPYTVTILSPATHLFNLSYTLGLLSEPGNNFSLSYDLGLLDIVEHFFDLTFDIQTAQLIEYDSPIGLEMLSEAGIQSINEFKLKHTVATVSTVTPTFNLPYTLILEDGVYTFNCSYVFNKDETVLNFSLPYRYSKTEEKTNAFALSFVLNKDPEVIINAFNLSYRTGLITINSKIFTLPFDFKYEKDSVFNLGYRIGRLDTGTHTFQAPFNLSRLAEDNIFKVFNLPFRYSKSKEKKFSWEMPYIMSRSQELEQFYTFPSRLRMIENDLTFRTTFEVQGDTSVDMIVSILPDDLPLGAYYIVVDNGGKFNKYTVLTNKGEDILDKPVEITYGEQITLTPFVPGDVEKIYTVNDVVNYNGYYGWPNASSLHGLGSGELIADSGFTNGIPGQRPYSNDADFFDITITDEGYHIFDLDIEPDTPRFTEVLYLIDKATNRIIRTGFAGTSDMARVIAYLKPGQYRLVPTAIEVDLDNDENTYKIYAWGESFNKTIEFLDPGYSIAGPAEIPPEFNHSISEFIIRVKAIEKESSINLTFMDHDLNELPETLPSQIYVAPADQTTLIPTLKVQETNKLRASIRINDPCCFNKVVSIDTDTSCSIPDEIKVDLNYNTNRVRAAVNKRFNLNSIIFFDD